MPFRLHGRPQFEILWPVVQRVPVDMVHDLVVFERPSQHPGHHEAVLQHVGLSTGQLAVTRRDGNLSVSMADASIPGDLTYRYIGLDRAGQLQALVVRLAQALGMAAASAAVDSALLGLGTSARTSPVRIQRR